jgi:hypothetical protein
VTALSLLAFAGALTAGVVGIAWGFCKVMMSLLRAAVRYQAKIEIEKVLLEIHVSYEVPIALDALSQKDIPGRSDSYNMGMLVEALECDGIMHLAVAISSVMKGDER